MPAPRAKDNFQTTLNGSITDSDVTLNLSDDPGINDSFFVIDPTIADKREVVGYTTNSNGVITGITRGLDGTVAQSHDNGAIVRFALTASHLNTFADTIDQSIQASDDNVFTGNNTFNGTTTFNQIPTIPSIVPVTDGQVVSKAELDRRVIDATTGVAGIQSDGGATRTGNINLISGTGITIVDNADSSFTVNSGLSFSGVQLILNATSIPSAISTDLEYTGTNFDTDSYFNISNNTRITVPATGKYLLNVQVSLATIGASTDDYLLSVDRNGSIFTAQSRTFITGRVPATLNRIIELNANDYIVLAIAQTSGAPLNVETATQRNYVELTRVE